MKKIYIAGPDVFFPDRVEHFAKVKALLETAGLQGVPPADGELSKGAECNPVTAERIFKQNVALIHECDALLVNLNHWRGTEPDSGTVFEQGLAFGLGKPVVGYIDTPELYGDRVARMCGVMRGPSTPSARFDAQTGCLIEEMGLPLNLMLVFSGTIVSSGVEDAVKKLAEILK